MHPIAFQIGSFAVRWYGIMAAVGFLGACGVLAANRKYAGMSADQASNSLLTAMIAGIVGARVFYVVEFFPRYRDNLGEIFRIDHGGLVFYGGFLLAMAALYLFCRRSKLDFIRVLDVYAPAIALGHACGRIGCFLNGCCYGKPTELCWAVHFPPGSEAALRYGGAGVHPVQLYESGENLLAFWLYWILVRKCPRGVAASTYLLVYGVLRFLNEYARGDNARIWNLFTPAQLIGLVLIPAGALLLIGFLRHARKNRI